LRPLSLAAGLAIALGAEPGCRHHEAQLTPLVKPDEAALYEAIKPYSEVVEWWGN